LEFSNSIGLFRKFYEQIDYEHFKMDVLNGINFILQRFYNTRQNSNLLEKF